RAVLSFFMLDFSSIKSQINKMIEERKGVDEGFLEKVNLAYGELKLRSKNWEDLSRKVALSRTPWLLAGVLEAPHVTHPLPPRPSGYTVFASDGSQIFPDRHEALPCYLINIGSVVLSYGSDGGAKLFSYPRFFYRDEDRFTVWDGRRVPTDTVLVSEKRTLMEFEEVLRLAEERKKEGDTVALSDGTLILWRLEGTPEDFRKGIIDPFIGVMDRLRSLRIPIVGYISFPGSTDVINTLRLGLCPEEISYCDRCPYKHLPELPCAPIDGVTDRVLFSRVLKPGERTSIFQSSSRILELYGDHGICFFYLNIGEEIARVEIPKWVAEDSELLGLVQAVVFDQAKKGGGYPVALIEAHEQAVIKAKDRDFFFELIREALVMSDFKVTVSRKGLSKRSPGV
ncbi:MAG TPA: DNA double-strand break repair nuclease NurA, partial [Thermodesulfobacteriota bacterium]|nr:DNA double-strand break repair nuclease NurA [Thermodesulfobacteriota bacterium]